ncbi:MAG: hypothetical protein RI983_185 [Bacteroidota bacterium]|jgi:RimJ/RimL family protein N-acetyltransferase
MFRLESARLLIRPISIIDAVFMLQLMNTSGWLEFIGDRNVKDRTAASNYILTRIIPSYHAYGFGLYLVLLKDKNIPIGICGLVKRDGLEFPDLGFAILPDYERQGYTSEACRSILSYAEANLSVPTIYGITTKANIAAIKVLEKQGLRFQQTVQLPQNNKEFLLFAKALHKEDAEP